MKALISGVAGFRGSGLAEALVYRGHKVTGLYVAAPNEAQAGKRRLSHDKGLEEA